MSEVSEKNTEIKDRLFREKSLQRISSPEELNDYVRVVNPGVWMILIAIAILLIGFCVWGIFGHIETKTDVVIVTQNGQSIGFVSEENYKDITPGMEVQCGENRFKIVDVSAHAGDSAEILSDYAIHALKAESGEWVHSFELDGKTPDDGVFPATVTIESINPISFIIN